MIRIRTYIGLLIILFLILSGASQAFAQASVRLVIEEIKDEQFPNLQAYLSVTDVLGFPVKDLKADNFSFNEDGKPITDFQIESVLHTEQPLAFVLLIDTSGSMKKSGTVNPILDAKNAAKEFIAGLGPLDQVAVVSFSDQANVIQDLTADKNLAIAAIDSLNSEGETAMYDAMVKGVELVKTRPERRVIILITDGKDTNSQFKLEDAINEAVLWKAPVYPIGFGSVDKNELNNIAQFTGGAAQIKPKTDQLKEALDTVVQTLREQYLVRFASSLTADGKEHDLTANVSFEGWTDDDTAQFTAVPGDVSVTIPSYTDGQIVAGQILIAPEVIAPAAAKSMEVYINGEASGNDVEPPLEFSWDSTQATPGDYEIKLVVKDAAGNSAEKILKLTVRSPLLVEITSPTNGSNVAGTVDIIAQVDSFFKLDKVDVIADGEVLQTFTAPPYEVKWGIAKKEPGPYEIKTIAYDVLGNQAENAVDVVVSGTKGGGGWGWIIVLIIAVAALFIPVGILSRRKVRKSTPSGNLPPKMPGAVAGGPSLFELQGHYPGQTWQLTSPEVHLGRKGDENDIRLKGNSASRRQAVIRLQQGQYVIESLNPENPILVNNQPVLQPQFLMPGDILQAGESVFRFDR